MHRTRREFNVLVIDADPQVFTQLKDPMRASGLTVHGAACAAEGLLRARNLRPSAVILEVGVPGVGEFELLGRMRDHGIHVPAIFLSSRTLPRDRLVGLSIGGDDYITKPFHPEEVVSRLSAILRRVDPARIRCSRLVYADLELDEETTEAYRGGQVVSLSPTEFALLHYLMMNAGMTLSKRMIRDHVWRSNYAQDSTIVESYISYLRRKVDSLGVPLIHTVRGVGYTLRSDR